MPTSSPCAYCRRRPIESAFQPFCSSRCKMADLGRWLRGDYRVAGGSTESTSTDPEDTRRSTGIDDR